LFYEDRFYNRNRRDSQSRFAATGSRGVARERTFVQLSPAFFAIDEPFLRAEPQLLDRQFAFLWRQPAGLVERDISES
jgi:hypothetical protein